MHFAPKKFFDIFKVDFVDLTWIELEQKKISNSTKNVKTISKLWF